MLFRFRPRRAIPGSCPSPIQILYSWVNFLTITATQRCQEQAPGKLWSSGQAAKTTWTTWYKFLHCMRRISKFFWRPIKSWDPLAPREDCVAQVPGSENRFWDWQAGGRKEDCLLMEVFNAVDEATSIHGEWDPIQATVAHHTGEAVRMVGLPGGSENPLHDGLGAHTALLQGILERERTMLMMRRPFHSDLQHDGYYHRTYWLGCSPQSVLL